MKRVLICVLLVLALSACRAETPVETGVDDGAPESANQSLDEIGTTLAALKRAYPEGEIFFRADGYPDAAAVCFGEPDTQIAYVFGETQGYDYERVMDACPEQLKCCGILATVGILFPDTPDVIAFSDFFAQIGVSDYSWFVEEETITAQGWLNFMYDDKSVWINANKRDETGGWTFTGSQEIRADAPIILTDEGLEAENMTLVETFFEE